MYGENGEVEYGGDMTNAFPRPTTSPAIWPALFLGVAPEDWAKAYWKQTFTYKGPAIADLKHVGWVPFHGVLSPLDPQELYYYVSENTIPGQSGWPLRGTYSNMPA